MPRIYNHLDGTIVTSTFQRRWAIRAPDPLPKHLERARIRFAPVTGVEDPQGSANDRASTLLAAGDDGDAQ